MVYEIWGKRTFRFCFVGCCFQDLFKAVRSILVQFPSRLFSMYFVKVHVVLSYTNSTDTPTAWKNSRFILSDWSDFQIVHNQLIAAYVFPMCMLVSLSVDEIWLPKYMNWPTNFRGLSFKEMATSWLKTHQTSCRDRYLFLPAPVYTAGLTWVGVSKRSDRSFV